MTDPPSDSVEHDEATSHRPSLAGHLRIARFDHWLKNVFVLPGVVAAVGLDPEPLPGLPWRLVVGLLATGLIASSNYVLNELLDAPYDRHHPMKRRRPVPAGEVSLPMAWAQWLVFGATGLALGRALSPLFAATMLAFWLMGCVYNVPPLRSKDLPYLDVLSEAINNPLRLLAGWWLTGTELIGPASMLLAYWMAGCYFMAIKRFAELRELDDTAAAAYRRSFRFYSADRLLVSIMFYASAAMLFLGAFIMRYRLELILSVPFVSLVMAVYLALALRQRSPVQTPERLYREPALMASLLVCAAVMTWLLWQDLPILHRIFSPTAPTDAWIHGA